jgi:hypothetical protein
MAASFRPAIGRMMITFAVSGLRPSSPLLTFGIASESRRSAQDAFVNPAERVAIQD